MGRRVAMAALLAASMVVAIPPVAAAPSAPQVAFFDPARGVWSMEGIGQFYYGIPGDRPMLCDWNGDGTETVGLYRSSTGFLHLRQQNTFGIADVAFFFGIPEDIPVCGDWNADGRDSIGVYRPSTRTFFLHNGLETAFAEHQFTFGPGYGVPIAGDWDGDGIDTVGLWDPWTGRYQLSGDTSGVIEWQGYHGSSGDRVVVGDFDGNGKDTIGAHRPSTGALTLAPWGEAAGAPLEYDAGVGTGFSVAGLTGGTPATPINSGPTVPPGAVSVWPGQNIQVAVDAAGDGATIYIRAGVHRMQSIQPRRGSTIVAEAGAILNGSRVLDGWRRDGGQWWVGGQTQQGTRLGMCEGGAPRCNYPEQLFVNNSRLEHVDSRSQVGPNSWFFDYGADRIYIGQDPAGKTVETSVTARAFYGDRPDVTVSGLIIEKYANPAQHGAIDNRFNNADDGADDWLVIGNEVRWNHGTGIKVGKNAVVQDNFVHHNGQHGLGAVGSGAIFDGNEVAYNGELRYEVDWERGGTKFAGTENIQLINNHVHHNNGPGLWADMNARHMLFANNTVVGNSKAGVYYEISYDAVIRDNYIEGNGFGFDPWLWGGGIVISSSPNVEISGNTVVNNADGIGAVEQDRSRDPARYGPLRIENLYVHHNTVTMSQGSTGVAQDVGDKAVFQSRNNRFEHNTYHIGAGNWFEWDNRQMSYSSWRGYGLN
jgi:parallel beta-helix repeat protein